MFFFWIEAAKIEQDYPQRYPQSPSNDFISTPYDNGSLPKNYGLPTGLYDDVSYLSRWITIHLLIFV